MARSVRTIPASISQNTGASIGTLEKRKVCAYARVSTDSDEQQTSYDAQIDYYTNYIKGREDWEFVGMYSDEGISGTNTKKREGFKQMISDALEGKIDLIITKSVSRFARNTVDSLSTIRDLKEHKVECYFEKENIWTFDGKGELLITIMSSLAQEESRSISENVTWGQRKRFQDGKVSVPFGIFLGYDKGDDGNLVVNEEQAVVVRKIYRYFLEGLTPYSVAKRLTEEGIPTPGGKTNWDKSTVKRILQNEKYKGDALLQKNYTVDFLTKKQKVNNGEIPQYYVENNHEPIVSKELFEMVQDEIKKREKTKGRYSGVDILASKIKCMDCGHLYGSKVWHSTSKYRKKIYQCSCKFTNEVKCATPHFTEDDIKTMFVKAVNELLIDKEELIKNLEFIRKKLSNKGTLETERDNLHNEMTEVVESIQNLVNENARVVQNQDEYQSRYNEMVVMYESLKVKIDEVEKKISDILTRREVLGHFIKTLKDQGGVITEFDEGLWGSLLECIEVENSGVVRCGFKDGSLIELNM